MTKMLKSMINFFVRLFRKGPSSEDQDFEKRLKKMRKNDPFIYK
jgi:hypothetical protein